MKHIFTFLTSLSFMTIFFTSCGQKEEVEPQNCHVVKEFLISSGSRQLLNLYEYDEAGKILKISHQEPAGAPTESRFEYNSEGRLIKLYDTFTLGSAGTPFKGYLNYLYDSEGLLYQIDAYKIENGQTSLFQVFVVYYDINKNKIIQVITSFGERYRFEYDEKDNATKTLYKPLTSPEYVLEEYNGYSGEILDTKNNQPFLLRNFFFNLKGCNFSHNQVISFKVYNNDSSLQATQTVARELNTEGKLIKETTTINTNGTITSRITEKVYPACK